MPAGQGRAWLKQGAVEMPLCTLGRSWSRYTTNPNMTRHEYGDVAFWGVSHVTANYESETVNRGLTPV